MPEGLQPRPCPCRRAPKTRSGREEGIEGAWASLFAVEAGADEAENRTEKICSTSMQGLLAAERPIHMIDQVLECPD